MSMTWGQLKKEVLTLGFEDEAIYDSYREQFIVAANSALDILSETVRPLFGSINMHQSAVKNLIDDSGVVEYSRNAPLVYSAQEVEAYYFECDGNGTAIVTADDVTTELALVSRGEFVTYKGIAKGTVQLQFQGEYNYTVRKVAMFNGLKGGTIEHIPEYGNKVAYDMNVLLGERFAGFVTEPVWQNDVRGDYPLRSAEVQDRVVLLPAEFEGEFEVRYKRRHQYITGATPDDEVVEVALGLQSLLPLLMANRIWLDDDERKATYYWNMYEMLRNRLTSGSDSAMGGTEFVNERNW